MGWVPGPKILELHVPVSSVPLPHPRIKLLTLGYGDLALLHHLTSL